MLYVGQNLYFMSVSAFKALQPCMCVVQSTSRGVCVWSRVLAEECVCGPEECVVQSTSRGVLRLKVETLE